MESSTEEPGEQTRCFMAHKCYGEDAESEYLHSNDTSHKTHLTGFKDTERINGADIYTDYNCMEENTGDQWFMKSGAINKEQISNYE